jgi:hypothetical protein
MKATQQHALDYSQRPPSKMTIAILALAFAGLGWLLPGCVPTAVHPFRSLMSSCLMVAWS